MNEHEWLDCSDPVRMIGFVADESDDRLLRLFACACCRQMWGSLTDDRYRKAIQIAEFYSDGKANEEEFNQAADVVRGIVETVTNAYERARAHAEGVVIDEHERAARKLSPRFNEMQVAAAVALVMGPARDIARSVPRLQPYRMGWDEATQHQAAIVRDIFGNPFRPICPGPWVTPAAVTIARDINDRRDFAALLLLADLLEEAGCPEQSVLDHCRQPGEHVMGCWVVDLVLEKEQGSGPCAPTDPGSETC
jgi:hypothetical protein